MKTPSLPKVHIKLPNVTKRVVLIAAGAVVVLALFSFGVVSQVRAERAQVETDRVKAAQTAQAEKTRQAQIDHQTVLLTAESAKRGQVCNYVRSLAAARATAKLVSVPAACN